MQRNKAGIDDSKPCKNQTRHSIPPFCFPPFMKGLQAFIWNLSLNLFSIDGSNWKSFQPEKVKLSQTSFACSKHTNWLFFKKSELNHMLWIQKWDYILKGCIILKSPCVCVCACTCLHVRECTCMPVCGGVCAPVRHGQVKACSLSTLLCRWSWNGDSGMGDGYQDFTTVPLRDCLLRTLERQAHSKYTPR